MKNRHTHNPLLAQGTSMMVDEGLDPMCILVQPFVGDCSLAGFIMAKTPTKKILQIISKLFLKYRVQSSNRPFCDQTFQHRLKVGNSNELRL